MLRAGRSEIVQLHPYSMVRVRASQKRTRPMEKRTHLAHEHGGHLLTMWVWVALAALACAQPMAEPLCRS